VQSFDRVLSSLGHSCSVFRSGESAVAAYRTGEFDVVITDYRMPHMNGVSVIKTLKKVDPGAFVIVITGYGSLDVALDSLGNGAYYYMTKPVDFDELNEVLQRIAAERTTQKRLRSMNNGR